jgi:argininosuccinate lyase
VTLWQTSDHSPDQTLDEFTASEDSELDNELLEPDIMVNIAHSQMLAEQDYLTEEEKDDLHTALLQLHEDQPDISGFEDVHTAIEKLITQENQAGTKLHTARSRNDQIATDTLIWLRWQAIETAKKVTAVVEGLEALGDNTVIPGRTHSRQAMPTTVENWVGSVAAAFLDGLKQLEVLYDQCLSCPLGAAAGFGTHLEIDREGAAELLGFEDVQDNTIHAVQSRGTYSLTALQAVQSIALVLSDLADAVVHHTGPDGWLELSESMTTGSSIMPQKNNPDGLELIRARCTELLNAPGTAASILQGGMTGYNRDLQQTKPLVMESFSQLQDCLDAMAAHIQALSIDEQAASSSLNDDITAAAAANELVENGTPFRQAYQQVKEDGHPDDMEPEPAASSFPTDGLAATIQAWQDKAADEQAWQEELLALAADGDDEQKPTKAS